MLPCDEAGDSDGPIAIERLAQKSEHWPPQSVYQIKTRSKHRRENDGRPEIAAGTPAEELAEGRNLQGIRDGTVLYDTGRSVLGCDEVFSRSGVFPGRKR